MFDTIRYALMAAWHVLRGHPVIYGVTFTDRVQILEATPTEGMIVRNLFDDDASRNIGVIVCRQTTDRPGYVWRVHSCAVLGETDTGDKAHV